MRDAGTFKGSCHCGAVRFEADLGAGPVNACNCSMCGRAGTLLTFTPASSFRLLSGADNLTSYFFNKHVIDHVFCKTCGIKSFARGKTPDGHDIVAVNARCLDGVDVATLEVKHIDGRAF